MGEAIASSGNRWHAPWVCALVAFAIRALYLLIAADEPTFLSPGMDAEIYRSWADAILAGNPPAGPYFRAPLYPWLIAGLGVIFGDTFWPIRIVQVLVGSLAAGGMATLARRWIGTRVGWIAGLAWALYGASIYFDGEGLIASLFTSGIIGVLLLLDNSLKRRWMLNAFLLAILFAALTLLRANALAYAPVILLTLWWSGRVRRIPALNRVLTLTGATLLVLVLLFPILRHNAQHGAGWSISGQGGINLFLGNRAGASGAYAVDPDYGPDWTRAQIVRRAEHDSGRTLTAAEVSSHYSRAALQYWTSDPGDALMLTARKALALINWRELGNNRPLWPYLLHTSPVHAGLLAVGFPLIAILGLAFLLPAWRELPGIRPALLLALIHGVVVVAFFVNARYRFPLTPALILLFAFGLNRLLPTSQQAPVTRPIWRNRGLALAALGLLVLLPRPIPAINSDDNWQLHRANALLRLERYDQAADAFQQLLRSYPDTRHGHLNLGVIYLQQGNVPEARREFQLELEVRPGNALAWNNLGVTFEQTSMPDSALFAYRQALNADPSNPDAHANLLRLLTTESTHAAEAGDVDAALRLSREALTIRPDLLKNRFNYALLLAAAGQLDAAADSLRAIRQSYPEFEPARAALEQLNP
ncbi:tetratricopeptide repeat protein [bacterium]|nr:tetratricopeptide repeat protein [bacterium]